MFPGGGRGFPIAAVPGKYADIFGQNEQEIDKFAARLTVEHGL
jgi:hypothetical protein